MIYILGVGFKEENLTDIKVSFQVFYWPPTHSSTNSYILSSISCSNFWILNVSVLPNAKVLMYFSEAHKTMRVYKVYECVFGEFIPFWRFLTRVKFSKKLLIVHIRTIYLLHTTLKHMKNFAFDAFFICVVFLLNISLQQWLRAVQPDDITEGSTQVSI